MKWKTTNKRRPKEGSIVLGFWGEDAKGSYGVVKFSGGGHWHEPEDDENDYRAPDYWRELPASPFAAIRESTPE
jgi:hypothetical protein